MQDFRVNLMHEAVQLETLSKRGSLAQGTAKVVALADPQKLKHLYNVSIGRAKRVQTA